MSSANTAKTMFYKITQTRSTIGCHPRIRKNIEALGLKKRNQIIYQRVSPSTAHRISVVKELVKIELVDKPKSQDELAAERKFKPGFEMIKGDMLNKSYQ